MLQLEFQQSGLGRAPILRLSAAWATTPPRPSNSKRYPRSSRAETSSAARKPVPARPPRSRCPRFSACGPATKRPAALIVTPTRELALQIEGVAKQAARFTHHRVAVVYGGVGYGPQAAALRRGVDILVATPGRLFDLCNQGDCKLDRRSKSSCSTKPTACSTWASGQT